MADSFGPKGLITLSKIGSRIHERSIRYLYRIGKPASQIYKISRYLKQNLDPSHRKSMIILDLWFCDCWVTITHIPDFCWTLPRSKDNRQSLSTSWEYSLTSSLSAKTKCKMYSVSHSIRLSSSVCSWCFWKIGYSHAYLDMCVSHLSFYLRVWVLNHYIYIYV